VKSELSTLEQWTRKTGRESCDASKVETIVGEDSCYAVVTDCVPTHVQKYHESVGDLDSPNCWNLALVMSGLVPELRYSSPDEMTFFMNEPFCRGLKNGEKREPGDIGTIRNTHDGSEVHGFVYISENLVYTKNGPDIKNPFEVRDFIEVMEEYDVDDLNNKNCTDNERGSPLDNEAGKGCFRNIEYFRCSTMEEFLDSNKLLIRESIIENKRQLDSIECKVNQVIFNYSNLSNGEVSRVMMTTIEILTKMLEGEIKELSSLNEEERLVINSIRVRLISLSESLIGRRNEDGSVIVQGNDESELRSLERLFMDAANQL
jgi:hypothetical protein